MEERQVTPALQEFPQLRRLPFFSAQNQGFIADYLAHLRARYYAPSMQEATLRALKSFAVLMPKVRQAVLYEDLTQTTPADIDAWIDASFQQRLAPGTIETRLRVVQGVLPSGVIRAMWPSHPFGVHAIRSWCPRTSPAPWLRTRSSRSFASSMPCETARCFC
jgi:hypothetical protein